MSKEKFIKLTMSFILIFIITMAIVPIGKLFMWVAFIFFISSVVIQIIWNQKYKP